MPLASGTRLGVYEIIDALGVGGMGEVYRARDTKLRREVAIKILPEAFALDPDRVARFQREAELLASLNHPNIAQIYGLERQDGREGKDLHAIVLELVEGDTLAGRIEGLRAKGSLLRASGTSAGQAGLALDETLPIARQIVDALEAAHDRGVIHRDLKPANIKITPEGKVKVLDFGLAKAIEGAGMAGRSGGVGAPGGSMSPTLSVHGTFAGVILGTAAYMSPEQARGKPVDRRADIWAFGCVLYEMLTGKQTFDSGDTISDAVAAILRADPDWSALPADTPPYIRSILRRCLQKDAQKRLPHIAVIRLELDEPPVDVAQSSITVTAPALLPSKPLWKRSLPVAAAAIVVSVLAAVATWMLKPSPSQPITRFSVALGEGQNFSGTSRPLVTISPDGTHMVYVANSRLYLRSLSDLEARPIAGTEVTGGNVYAPVFSPDGRSLAYINSADRTLRRVALSGGAAVTVCAVGNTSPFSLSWDTDGILFTTGAGIFRVSANGGKPEPLIEGKPGEVFRAPQTLPDGKTILFTVASGSDGGVVSWDSARIVAQSLKSGQRTILVEGGTAGRYLPTGHIAYALRGVLFAVPFDARRVAVTGGPVPLVEGVRTDAGSAHFSFSDTGWLVYLPGVVSTSGQADLALVDRQGNAQPLKMPPGQYLTPRVSPDGRQVAFGLDDGKEQMIWVYDLSGTTAMRRLTFGGKNRYPVWSADSQRVAFQSDREGDAAIFWQRADGNGSAERLTKAEKDTAHVPSSWSPDGKNLLFSLTKGSNESLSNFTLSNKKAAPFADVRSLNAINATFSPDGRWVAYQSWDTEAAATQIYVQPFPPTGVKYQVSKTITNSHFPLWSRDGRELFYIPGPNRLSVTSLTTKPTFTFSEATSLQRGSLFDGGPTFVRTFDIARDGRILAVVPVGQTESGTTRAPQIQVVLNWFEDVKQRVPTQ